MTDASGRFHFGRWINPSARSITLTARAPDLAAVVRRISRNGLASAANASDDPKVAPQRTGC